MGDNLTIPHVQDHGKENRHHKFPVIDPDDWIDHTYLMDEQEDGSHHHAHIVHAVEDHDQDFANQPDCMKFVNDDEFEDIVTYNELMDYFGKAKDEHGQLWKFHHIVHCQPSQGPLKQNHPDYNGSSYDIMLEWENGENMPEPLDVVAKDNTITCAVYDKENGLLDAPGGKRFKPMAHRHKKFLWMVNQAKPSCSFHTAPRYKYGYNIPRDNDHAIWLDEKCGSTCWQDATALELAQLHETFKDLGYKAGTPDGYKKSCAHLVYDCKHDGRCKARMVVDSTAVPHAKLHKRHNALSFHCVGKAVVAKMALPYYLPGDLNPSDILTKHWGYVSIWHLLQLLLFYSGDTSNLLDHED
jgi:hypothetical protein